MWRTDTNLCWHVRAVLKGHAREMALADEMARLLNISLKDPRPGQIEIDHDKVSNWAPDDLVQLGEDMRPGNREALAPCAASSARCGRGSTS